MATSPATPASIFQFIGSTLDSALGSFVSGTANTVISTFSAFFIAGATIHLIFLGYAIGWGYVEIPFSTFIKTCVKYLIIGALALNASNYTSWIVDTINSLETGMTAAFGGSSGTPVTSVYQLIDQELSKGWTLAADLWQKAGDCGISEIGTMVEDYLYAIIIAIATGLLAIPAGGIIVVAKASITIMLGIGPLFIALLLWPPTAKFFDAWLGQILTYIIRIALIAAVMSLAFKGFENIVQPFNINDDSQSVFFTALVLITYTIVMFWLIGEANSVAGQLAGGISSTAITLRGMARGAMAPVSAAAKIVNGQSTRRDTESGMMVTASRLNHVVAGRTMVNPAYRQHVMQNLGKNWGRAAGGSTSESES